MIPSAFVSKAEMKQIFFKSNISILSKHFDKWWDSLIKMEGRIKWSTFVDGIVKGKKRGRGQYTNHDVPYRDRVEELARSPEIECLRSPDILSSPNR